MGLKTVRTSIRLDKEDIDFLRDVMVFENTSVGARWCIKFCRIYGLAAIRRIKEAEETTYDDRPHRCKRVQTM
jgi:hypothetical protein